jgi:anthranilate phosphoribosyltransferase
MMQSAIWNGGFYLWHCGICPTMEAGIAVTKEIINNNNAAQKLEEIRGAIAALQLAYKT